MEKSSINSQIPQGKSLCICLTPLHVLIAERVAEKTTQKFDQGIYLSYQDDEKTRVYFNRMTSFCSNIKFVMLPNDAIKSPLKHLKIFVQRWTFRFKNGAYANYSDIYLPTSSNLYLLVLLPILSKSTLITFDDGIVNIAYNEVHRQANHPGIFARLYTWATGVLCSLDKLIKLSTKHFSIYSDSVNVCKKNVQYVTLSGDHRLNADSSKVIKIFIGPPPEADSSIWQKVNEKILEISPDEFLPHPRDINQMAKNVAYSSTNLIAEDYVINVLEDNPDARIEIYGLQSSALLHLAKLPKVEVFSFIDNNPKNAYLIKLMSQYGIDFI